MVNEGQSEQKATTEVEKDGYNNKNSNNKNESSSSVYNSHVSVDISSATGLQNQQSLITNTKVVAPTPVLPVYK